MGIATANPPTRALLITTANAHAPIQHVLLEIVIVCLPDGSHTVWRESLPAR